MIYFKTKLGFYPCHLICIIDCNEDELLDVSKKKKLEIECNYDLDKLSGSYGAFFEMPDSPDVLWLENKPTNPKMISYMAHEISHAVFAAARHIGERDCGEEFYTYATQFLTETILNSIQ